MLQLLNKGDQIIEHRRDMDYIHVITRVTPKRAFTERNTFYREYDPAHPLRAIGEVNMGWGNRPTWRFGTPERVDMARNKEKHREVRCQVSDLLDKAARKVDCKLADLEKLRDALKEFVEPAA